MSNIEINLEKLKQVIEGQVKEMQESSFFCAGSVGLGQIGDLQIRLALTRDEDELQYDCDGVDETFKCIEAAQDTGQ